MFTRISSILSQAVEVIAPTAPQQNDFVAHWKAITSFFTSTKDHKVSIDQTSLPRHMTCMFELLQDEEEEGGPARTGPCLEYVLQHKILETLSTLARTDTPPGMRQEVLLFFTKLLSRLDQPLLPHVHVHKPVQRLVRLCGDQRAGPTEEEEIHFLCTLCAKFTGAPYLVNFFIETPTENTSANNNSSPARGLKMRKDLPVFPVVNSLLSLMESPDARVAVKSCEGLMLLCSLTEPSCALAIVEHTQLCDFLATQLCTLCKKLPFALSPVDIEATQAKWGMDVHTVREDAMNFPGKHHLVSFLSWLDYCDQLVSIATGVVAGAVAKRIRERFLGGLLQSNLLQTSEAGSISAMALLTRCLFCVHSGPLLQEFVRFILGEENRPETHIPDSATLRNRLISKCNHISDDMSLAALKLFDILLLKPDAFIYHNLVLRNLISRQYLQDNITDSITNQSRDANSGQVGEKASSRATDGNTGACGGEDAGENIDGAVKVGHGLSAAVGNEDSGDVRLKRTRRVSNSERESKAEGSGGNFEPVHTSESRDSDAVASSKGQQQLESESGKSQDQPEENLGAVENAKCTISENIDQNKQGAGEVSGFESENNQSRDQTGPIADIDASESKESDRDKSAAADDISSAVDKEEEEMMQLLSDLMAEQAESAQSATYSENPGEIREDSASLSTNQVSRQTSVKSQMSNDSEGFSVAHVDNGNRSDIHTLVKSILDLLPIEARSSADLGDTGYDTYLRDAHAQYADTCKMCQGFEWPPDVAEDSDYRSEVFFEGEFLKMILHRLSRIMDQSYEINLQLTSVLSKLALLPHPNLHEYMLHAGLPSKAAPSSLVRVLTKVCTEINKRLKEKPALISQLHALRKRLAAFNMDIRSVENGKVLAGIIVVEEFCKELAAIAFVKHHEMA